MPWNSEWYKEYRKKNKEKLRAYHRAYWIKNKKRLSESNRIRAREYYRRHKKEIRIRIKSIPAQIQPETKREYDKRFLNKKRFGGLREIVIKRDNGICQLCGMTRIQHKEKYGRDIVVDHIDGNGRNSKNPNNNLSNLRTLCLVCNLKVAREPRVNHLSINPQLCA